MALTDKLTAIADAIRGKTGKAEEMTLDQMAVEIGEIQTGGAVKSSWSRPWDWPNYDTMERPTTDVVYFTYDCRYDSYYASFYLDNGGLISMGYIDKGVFIEIETEEIVSRSTYYKNLSPDLGDYVVFRVMPLPNTDPSKFKICLNRPDGSVEFANNTCLEVWGRIQDGYALHYYVSHQGGITTRTKAVTLYDFSYRGLLSSFYNYGQSLEWANLDEWGLKGDVTSFGDSFRGTLLKEITIPKTWDLKNITNLSAMFRDSKFLSSVVIRNHNTEKVTNTSTMFMNSGLLQRVDLSGCNLNNVTNMNQMFDYCYDLREIYIDVIPRNVSFKQSERLSHDSLIRIINALTPVTATQTLTLGTINLAKLTEDEIAVATGKGWTVV